MSPKLPRLPGTSDASLGDRMSSVFENGYGDEGPVAKGCCLLLFLTVVMGPVLAGIGVVFWLVWYFT